MFSGLTAFDKHWSKVPMRAEAQCHDPEEVGLVQNAKGVWCFPWTAARAGLHDDRYDFWRSAP